MKFRNTEQLDFYLKMKRNNKDMKIALFFGSFNPVHKGHIAIMNYLLNNELVDKVLVVPTNNYWDKEISTSLENRIKMLKMYESSNIIIDTKHNNYNYTCDLLDALEKENPNNNYVLVMGDDNLMQLEKWKNYKSLINHEFAIFKRQCNNEIEIVNKCIDLGITKYNVFDLNTRSISSSLIRESIANNQNTDDLDADVYDYYKKNIIE